MQLECNRERCISADVRTSRKVVQLDALYSSGTLDPRSHLVGGLESQKSRSAMCIQDVRQYLCGCRVHIGEVKACAKKGTKDCKGTQENLLG
ncbi:hypothetical protein BST61_g8658 [Cercospora zeina]